MALTSVGLTDQGQGPGLTKNFAVAYESTLPNQARVIATANALLSVLESEFTVTIGWFGTDPAKFGPNHRQQVNLNLTGGGNNSGYGTAINVDAQANNPNAADAAARVQMIWMNEWVEILMSLSDGRWNAGNSMGEALSQYCGIVRFQTGHYSYYSSWVQQWLDTHPRQNFIDNTEPTDKNAISFGCGLAFLYYLTTQLGYDIRSVIAAGAPTFADVHAKLTGDHASPYVRFAALLERAYPSNLTIAIRGPVTDDPFPIAPVGRGRTAIHPRSDEGAVTLYAAGLDGRVWSAFWPKAAGSSDWSGWFPIGTNTFVTGAPITAIHPRSDEGAVTLYAAGLDGRVWSAFWPKAAGSSDWSGWFPIGTNTFVTGAPITAIHPRSDEGAVTLYAAGLDGRVWSAFWPKAAGSSDWSGWFPIGTNTFVTGAPITAIHPRSDEGAVSLYAAGLDGRVWSAFWPAAGSTNWSGWFPIGTNTFVTGAPITAIHPRSDEGAVTLYAAGLDGRVWSAFWPKAAGSSDWSGWFPIGTNTFVTGAPITAIHPRSDEGAVTLYAAGLDGRVWSAFWPKAAGSSDWSGWFPIGTNTFVTGAPITAIHPRSDEGAVTLYAAGLDGRVWSAYWPKAAGSSDWSGWFPIGTNTFVTG